MNLFVATLVLSAAAAQAEVPARDGAEHRSPDYDISIERVRDEIYNPWTQRMDEVELREFHSEGAQGLVAPTMRASPGEVIRLGLKNNLQPCGREEIERSECFNSTNIHTHGLWISPSGNSDNVLISVNPGKRFDYEFVIPQDHPAGTFFYHPHMHGATSIQLGSGMAGALIIDGDRVPTSTAPGDVDILFSQRSGQSFGEQIWVFSQIQYGCYDAEGHLKAPKSPDPEAKPWEQPAWACDIGDVGRVDTMDQFGPDLEFDSGRFIGVNGKVQPTISGIETGRFQRLRMIHAGLRRSVKVGIRRLADGAPDIRDVPAEHHREWIAKYCTGEPIGQFHFADDGLTRDAARPVSQVILYPGYRLDTLVYFDQPGKYCLINDQTWRQVPNDYRVLGILDVSGKAAPVGDVTEHLRQTLIGAANAKIADRRVRDRVVGDLSKGLRLSSFRWHEPVRDEELTGHQSAMFSIVEHDDGSATLSIDGKPFDHDRVDRRLTLGNAEEWELTSNLANHPFHIHVNPFQVISVLDEEGRDVTIEGTEAFDPDYDGIVGGWRDTIIVKRGYKVTMRTRYRRFIGDFVMHCHFASHGDAGMMQRISMVLPDAVATPHVGH